MKKFEIVSFSKMDGVMWKLNFEIPTPCMITFMREVDMTAIEAVRNEYFVTHQLKPSYTALLAKAITNGLSEYPYANRRIFSWPFFQRAVQFDDINITVAVEQTNEIMQAGVETLYNADELSLSEINIYFSPIAMSLPKE